MTDAQTEARAILRIDDKWSVEYDPANNDRAGRVLRYGEPVFGGSSDWKNDTRAMFYALLERDTALAAKDAELAARRKAAEHLLERAQTAEAQLAEANKALEEIGNGCDGRVNKDALPCRIARRAREAQGGE